VPEQLPVQFELQSTQNFSAFYPGNNKEVITHLQQLFINKEQLIFLWGARGSGKSHLLQAACQETDKTSFFFSLDKKALPPTSILDGLENIDLVCFDNIDQISGNSKWEQAFFNFFNLHRDNNNHLVLSAPCPPKYLEIQLPDLKTRMSWGLTLKLKLLSDEQLLNALTYKADVSGFEITPNVGKFLMTHYTSDLPSIWKLLNEIEQATLIAQRKLTIPFLKQIMDNQANKK
jgi:DnaA family protein